MSILRRALEVRRPEDAPEGHPCHRTSVQAFALAVETAADGCWLLPWTHFVHARLQSGETNESLVLTFTSHEVAIRGRNLGALLDAAGGLRLEKICAVPGDYAAAAETEPIITRIELLASDEPAESGDEARPPVRPPHRSPGSAKE